jgi:hypothetical protein
MPKSCQFPIALIASVYGETEFPGFVTPTSPTAMNPAKGEIILHTNSEVPPSSGNLADNPANPRAVNTEMTASISL